MLPALTQTLRRNRKAGQTEDKAPITPKGSRKWKERYNRRSSIIAFQHGGERDQCTGRSPRKTILPMNRNNKLVVHFNKVWTAP